MKIIRTCNIIPHDKENNKILLLKTINSPDKLTFLSGFIHKLDSDDEKIREITKDGLNCEAKEFTLLKKIQKTSKNKVIKSIYFSISILGEIKIEESKYSQANWYELNKELLENEFLFDEKEVIKELLHNNINNKNN